MEERANLHQNDRKLFTRFIRSANNYYNNERNAS